MERRTLVIVAILLLFTVSYTLLRIEHPTKELDNHKQLEPSITNVTLGYISSATSYLAQDQFLISQAVNDVNEYCESNNISYRFNVSIRDAEGHAENAAKYTQEFIENNVSLIGGYAWSSHLGASIHTTTKYNGILFSTASTYLYYGRPEQVFRLCPTDLHQVKPIIAMLNDYNVSRIIIFRGADAWADLMTYEFTQCYSGEILEEIEYPVAGTDFRKGLERLETSLKEYNESNKPYVLFLDKSNPAMVLAQAVDFPVLLNIKWFGSSDGYARRQILDDAGEVAAKVGLISLMITVDPEVPGFQEINEEFLEEFGLELRYYQANVYDCCWLMAHCIIDLNTTDVDTIKEYGIEVASNHQGITGNLILDQYGDRLSAPYVLYGFYEEDSKFVSRICGFYNQDTEMITWNLRTH